MMLITEGCHEYSLMNFTFFDAFGCFARTFVDGFFPARPPTARREFFLRISTHFKEQEEEEEDES
jgi:hypothetical protein